jgi:hypothetical protein
MKFAWNQPHLKKSIKYARTASKPIARDTRSSMSKKAQNEEKQKFNIELFACKL